ncbi:MAG: glycosyltransferase [Bacteroidetes bacterium]|nr:glycosyltransferase [Bacteroidota bacterium]
MTDLLVFWPLIVLSSAYLLLHIAVCKGLNGPAAPKYSGPVRPISVIIAARNEERNIEPLLRSLTAQDFPSDAYEIIIVNDRSEDGTAALVRAAAATAPNIRLIDIRENTSGMPNKKHALQRGIEAARHELLAFTDADCIVPAGWLTGIHEAFTDEVGLVAGYSPYVEGTVNTFLRYEEMKNSLYAAAAVPFGQAFMCTGRNIAYRASVFREVDGFARIAHSVSGDDDLFLQLVERTTSWQIRYTTDPGCAVRTLPPDSFGQFIHQRTRHVSASSYYPVTIKAAYAVSHLFHLSLMSALLFTPVTGMVCLALKFITDGAAVSIAMKRFEERFSVLQFYYSEILLVLYTFLIAPLGFFRSFSWKGASSQ